MKPQSKCHCSAIRIQPGTPPWQGDGHHRGWPGRRKWLPASHAFGLPAALSRGHTSTMGESLHSVLPSGSVLRSKCVRIRCLEAVASSGPTCGAAGGRESSCPGNRRDCGSSMQHGTVPASSLLIISIPPVAKQGRKCTDLEQVTASFDRKFNDKKLRCGTIADLPEPFSPTKARSWRGRLQTNAMQT